LSHKLNAELLQLSEFEAAVAAQYREGETAQRHVQRMLMQMHPGGGGVGGDGRGGVAGVGGGGVGVGGRPGAGLVAGSTLADKLVLPSPYHWSKMQEWVTGVSALRAQVAAVEEYLATASASAAAAASSSSASANLFASPQALSHVLSSHHSALLHVSARVASLHDGVSAVRERFTALFGREGAARLEEERSKEEQKKEAFDLNAPNSATPLVSSQAHATSLQAQSVAANTAATAAAAGTQPAAGTTTAPAAATGFGTSLFGTGATGAAAPAAGTAPAAAGFGFGFGTAPATTTTTTAAPAATGFGGFGTPAAAAPAATGFGTGFGAPATGGFGAPAAGGGFGGGFGALPPTTTPTLQRGKTGSKKK
jgi:hypothetical protein